MNSFKHTLPALVLAGIGFASNASATLLTRPGGMVYDTDLNITWLQDANYAQTSGYDADGRMDWSTATTWAANLVYGGYSDWRLPTTTDTGAAGCDFTFSGTDCGYNVNPSTSELAHLFFVELGNLSEYDTNGDFRGGSSGVDWGVVNSGPFMNLQNFAYWSGTEYPQEPDNAWRFGTYDGGQDHAIYIVAYYGWAVRSGDVAAAVPEPASLTLLGVGLVGWIGAYKRRQG